MVGTDEISTTSHDYAIQVKGLTKSFGNHAVLRGIDFEVMAGESIVIFGTNGAGKTTLIKILATIMNPSSGSILFDGLSVGTNAESIRQKIGVITHQTFLYNTLTAYENLKFYCRMYDVHSHDTRIREVIEIVGLSSRLHDRIGTFSRGMQQRLSIARALLHDPAIMLLDEPETGLDQQATSILHEVLNRGGGRKRTVILTTHNLERGLALGDRLLILDQGTIVYEKSTEALDLATLQEVYRHITKVKA